MLSVQLIEYGEPGDNLRVVEVPDPRVGDNDVLVEVKARPINPSDVHFIQGDYGYKPMLPSPCGRCDRISSLMNGMNGCNNRMVRSRM